MFKVNYQYIITIENLLATWEHFLSGKTTKKDVISYQLKLADNIFELHKELSDKTYIHGSYEAFNISDPKPRNIHKALVRDRIIHHLIYRELYQYFDSRFIFDSYSCRLRKGTHRATDRFKYFSKKVSKNYSRSCYVLKCDIKKFFASIDHSILLNILERYIVDKNIKWLIGQVVKSFHATEEGVGLPLGNLTSQLLVNVYMHEFDMFAKQELRVKYYIRYADDFVVLSDNKKYLQDILVKIERFLNEKLHLQLHPDKVYIKTFSTGVDFLGWVHFPHHGVIRTSTKKRMIKNMRWYPRPETRNSYRGLLGHGDTYKTKSRCLL